MMSERGLPSKPLSSNIRFVVCRFFVVRANPLQSDAATKHFPLFQYVRVRLTKCEDPFLQHDSNEYPIVYYSNNITSFLHFTNHISGFVARCRIGTLSQELLSSIIGIEEDHRNPGDLCRDDVTFSVCQHYLLALCWRTPTAPYSLCHSQNLP